MPLLTSRGLAVTLSAAATLVAGLVTGSPALVVLGTAFGALVAGAALSLWVGGSPSAVRAHVDLPPAPLLQGAAATASLRFAVAVAVAVSGSRTSGPLLVEDPARAWVGDGSTRGVAQAADAGGVEPVGRDGPWRIVRLGRLCRVPPAGEASTVDVDVPTGRRGLRVLRPCPVWRADGLSLLVRRAGTTPPVPVLVCPRPVPVPVPGRRGAATATPLPVTAATSPSTAPVRQGDEGDEWTGLRAYVPGDRLAAVYWPHSVRRGELSVRAMSAASPDRLTVVVDLSTTAPAADVDSVVGVAAGMGVAALRQGRAVAVGAWRGGSTCRVASASTAAELLALLALVETMGGGWRTAAALGDADLDGVVVVFSRDGEVCVRGGLAPAAGSPSAGAT